MVKEEEKDENTSRDGIKVQVMIPNTAPESPPVIRTSKIPHNSESPFISIQIQQDSRMDCAQEQISSRQAIGDDTPFDIDQTENQIVSEDESDEEVQDSSLDLLPININVQALNEQVEDTCKVYDWEEAMILPLKIHPVDYINSNISEIMKSSSH